MNLKLQVCGSYILAEIILTSRVIGVTGIVFVMVEQRQYSKLKEKCSAKSSFDVAA